MLPYVRAACLSAVTNASRTNLMDLSTLNWHSPFLELFKAPPGIMPRIVSNAEVYGHVAEGPLKGVPIAGESQQNASRQLMTMAAVSRALLTGVVSEIGNLVMCATNRCGMV